MFGGKPRPKTALKAAITAALKAEDTNSNGSVSELKEVIANSVASQSGKNSGSGSGSETMPKLQEESGSDSVSAGNCSGTGFDANGYGRIDWIGSGNINNNSNSTGNISGSSRVSKGRKTIDNIIVGNDNRNRNENWNENGNSGSSDSGNGNNGNNGISSCGIFNRIFTRVDRLLRRWLPGYNYLRDGSGNRTSDTAENESGNESTHAEVTNEQPNELAEVQGSTSTVRGHWNKWLSNDIYLSVGITRAEFSAHLENILKKRMFQERKKAALAMANQ